MHLTIVYDQDCPFCCWCRDWLSSHDLLIPVTLRPANDPVARQQFGHLPGYGHEVLVADDQGHAWLGTDAFVMALWATRQFRSRAHGLTGPAARRLLYAVSTNRHHLSRVIRPTCEDALCP